MVRKLLIISLVISSEIIFGQGNVIFSTYTQLLETSLDGSNKKALISNNDIIDITDSKTKMYFSDMANQGIYEVDKITMVEIRLPIEGYAPKGLCYVEESNELYFADNIKKAIYKYNFLNNNVTEVVAGVKDAWEVCVNLKDDLIIWSEFAAQNLMLSDLKGNNRKLIKSGVFSLFQLEYNSPTKEIYYYQNGNSSTNSGIRKINLDGTNFKELVTDFSQGFSADFKNNKLYMFVGFGDLTTYDLNGVKIENVGTFSKVNSCYYSVFDSKIYFKSNNEEIAINEINLSTKLSKALKFNNVFSASGAIYDSLTQDVYYLNSGEGFNNVKAGTIFKYNLKTKSSTLILKDETVLAYPKDLDVDFKEKKIFWVDERYKAAFNCDLDGGNPKQLLQGSFSRVIALQLDQKSKLLHIFDASSNKLFEYNYLGQETYSFVVPTWNRPTDMCFDTKNKVFYISEERSKKIRSISRSTNNINDIYTHSSAILALEIIDSTLYFVDDNSTLFSLNLQKTTNQPLKVSDISSFNTARLTKINYYRKGSSGTTSIINNDYRSIEIYPNPNNGFFNIISNDEILHIDVVTANGIASKIELINGNNLIDLSYLDNGIYYLAIRFKTGESLVRKISIIK